MSKQSVNVIVHVSGNLGTAEHAGIVQGIAAQSGVSRAVPSPKAGRLILVDYDPGAISARRILGSIRERGVSAQLVGF
jgi:hypothetical protein